MARVHFNNFVTTVDATFDDTDTSITLADSLPTIGGGNTVRLTVFGGGIYEIIEIASNAGAPTYALNGGLSGRGLEGTAAATWAVGTAVECRFTAASVDDKADIADMPTDPTASAGTNNTRVGTQAGNDLASGSTENTLIGYQAGQNITTADYTVAIGSGALGAATSSGNYTVAIGAYALQSLNSGPNNIGIGYNAGGSQTTGSDSTFIGYNCAPAVTGGGNTAIGTRAMSSGTAGRFNCVVIGTDANQFGTGNYNVAIGAVLCGRQNGEATIAIGDSAGRDCTGTHNVFIGSGTGWGGSSGNNNILIGYNAQKSAGTVSNEITLGNSSIATLRCQVTSITALSDRRDKKEIEDIPHGLDLINAVRPVKFVWNRRDGSLMGVPEAGFIAQELQDAQATIGCDWLGLVHTANAERLEATPNKLLPVLVKAVQELSARLDQAERKFAERG